MTVTVADDDTPTVSLLQALYPDSDPDSRLLFAEMTMLDPISASHMREWIAAELADGHGAEEAIERAIGCLVRIRAACGVQGCGHA